MTHPDPQLSGPELDLAVAKVEGYEIEPGWTSKHGHYYLLSRGSVTIYRIGGQRWAERSYPEYSPSRNWSEGGPIIKKHKISIQPSGVANEYWFACLRLNRKLYSSLDEEPLVAVCRAYVAAKGG